MKRNLRSIGVCILLLTNMMPITTALTRDLTCHNNNLRCEQIPCNQNQAAEWTFLLYDDADFENAWDPLSNFTAEVYSGALVNFIVLQDTEHGPATLWQIDENHTLILLDELGEVNMGDPLTLKEFIEYGKSQFPANRYIMDMYNHGAGWKGACKDDTSEGDLLTMDEMQQALTEADGIDILMFNAPCLMGALESAYELRDCVEVYIGSEEMCGYKLGLAALICELLHTQSTLGTCDIGKEIIDFVEHLGGAWAQKRTMVAVQSEALPGLKTAINKLSLDLMLRWLRSYKKINVSRNDTFELGETPDVKERYREFDFIDFLEHLEAQGGISPRIKKDIAEVYTAFEHAVLKEFHGTSKPDVHGLSIYFPSSLMDGLYKQYRDSAYGLDFAKDTLWDEFLGLFILTNMILAR